MGDTPYRSPRADSVSDRKVVTYERMEQLVRGQETEEIAINDVSDFNLYGRKHRQGLPGSLHDEALERGFEPYIHQAVFWFCLVGLPLVPRGTYLVLSYKEPTDDDQYDCECYRALRIECDWSQIYVHYAISYTALFAVIVAVVLMIKRS
jgi:hypothetical protein